MEIGAVLIYRNELLPSSETFVLSQARALRRFQPLFGGLKRIHGGLDLSPYSVLTLSNSESWTEKANRRVFLRTGRSRAFVSAVAAQKPRIIHAHFAIDACAVLPIARKLRIPLIVTLHGYDVSCSEETFKRWPTTKAYLRRKEELWEHAALFICVSEQVKRRAIASGFPESKLWAHYIGVKLDEDKQPEFLRDKRTVLFVGRLVEKKGCIHLIRAMSRVQEIIPRARLVIAGDGPLRKALESEAALHCNDAIFLGYQSNASIKRWMRQAGVLVAPSIQARNGDAEGLPMVLCEAQAEGLPVVVFDTGGVTEALPIERRDALPPAGDCGALADEMIRLIKNDQAWQHASESGRQHMKSHFDLARQTQQLEARYQEIVTGTYV